MADPIFTLQADGLAVRSDNGTVLSEWWSKSSTPTTGLGSGYQARATITTQRLDGATATGVYGAWASLVVGQAWGLDSDGQEKGGLEFLLEIRRSSDLAIQASATITLGDLVGILDGDFYFPLGEASRDFRFTYSGSITGTLASDISIGIGDTVTFTYQATQPLSSNDNFIESSTGTNFFGSGSVDAEVNMTGYTATINGNAVVNGDPLPTAKQDNYPVGGLRLFHTVVLTATTATNVRFIGAAGMAAPISNVTIVTVGQTYIYPIDSTTVTNEDSNGSGNDLTLSSNSFWIEDPIMYNFGSNLVDIPYIYLDSANYNGLSAATITYNAASLRVDGSGGSIDIGTSSRWMGTSIENPLVPYANGFTIECIARFNANIIRGTGLTCGVISCTDNSAGTDLWVLGFDDYDGTASGSGTVVPNFSMVARNGSYDRSADALTSIVDLRGGTAVTATNIYHLMATIRQSNNSVEFWVNGVSVDTASISQGVMDGWLFGAFAEFGAQDIKNGIYGTRLNIGPRFADGAWRGGQDSHIQDLKIHLLEADQTFATRQAATANIT